MGPSGVFRVIMATPSLMLVKEIMTWLGEMGDIRGRVMKSLALVRFPWFCLD